jgi:5-methylthioadenosine/S-adenosylhomocysteine deaminase
VDLAIRGGTVVTQDAARRILRADIGIEGNRIRAVGVVPRAEVEIDATGSLVLPGLVNLHTHAAMTLLRGAADDLPLEQWLRERVWPIESKLTESDVRAGVRVALAEMAAGGTTTFNDMYFFAGACAEETAKAGLRGAMGPPFIDATTPEMPPSDILGAARAFARRWSGHDHVIPTIPVHSAYAVSEQGLAQAALLRRETGARIHAHLHETRAEVYETVGHYQARPFEIFSKAGLVERSIFAHGGWLTKGELETMAQAGSSLAHCPVSNFKLATGGWVALPEFWDAGGTAGLGTDGAASNNTLDMFETMKFAALSQKQHRWDATVAPAQKVLDMATRDGAKALGLDAGAIEVGRLADLIVVRGDRAHLTPRNDPVSLLVYAARASDVSHTIVNGRVVYENGLHPTLDVEAALDDAAVRSEALQGR